MTAPTSRLGRGLGSLLGEEGLVTDRSREVSTLSVDRIHPNKNQPRRHFDDDKLTELANSLKEKGMLQPVLVRQLEDGSYQIVAGERRWRAARMAGMDKIPVIEKDLSDVETLEISLLENIQREDLNAVEQARAFERLVNDYQYSHKQIGDAVGKSRMAISNSLRILKLPTDILQHIEQGRISAGHARALLARVDDGQFLADTVEKIIHDNLSVREVEKMTGRSVDPVVPSGSEDRVPEPAGTSPDSMMQWPPEETSVSEPPPLAQTTTEHSLSQRFSVAVSIQQRRGGKRCLIFECENDDDLQRIVNLLQSNHFVG
ncbi:MAG: ParB/RepB/Spo0J family partition protein [Magnetococcales bacterium]|nr:ParB/RepB/Spo0J family partition protein [Magnetococcales bacterium]